MTSSEIRKKYLEYFKSRGHVVIPSASLVPENDPTTLFTGSGMQPLLPYLLGEEHPEGTRLADSQKSFRAEDIEEVGDNRHTTFFEMLGNWSLGDYFKEEQLSWFFEFLTEELGLDPKKMYVTVFAGDEESGIPRDSESARIWQRLFKEKGIEAGEANITGKNEGGFDVDKYKIFYYGTGENWWSRAGAPEDMPAGEPGGPDSEVFYDFGSETPSGEARHTEKFGPVCHPACDCGRFLEIGNSVFMEYIKQEDGSFVNLPRKNVDFGGGLERITAAVNDESDVFLIDTLKTIIDELQKTTEKEYKAEARESFRIIADHVRGAVFIIGDGVEPSNTEEGYILRRLIRRSVRHLDLLGVQEYSLSTLVDNVVASYEDAYPQLKEKKDKISNTIHEEEEKFRKTLKKGLKEFEKLKEGGISGEEAFTLFSTYGFPIEFTLEMAQEEGVSVDVKGFKEEMEKHREISRSGSGQKFKGGLADHSDASVRYHTATHLLHRALRDVLGDHVHQTGSNITPDRLRFDFNFERKLTDEEKQKVEEIVNEKINSALPVTYDDVSIEEAEKRGAIGIFEESYGDKVRIYKIGDYSLEYCGGPHVRNTSELGHFKITKEESVGSGQRRIRAVLE